jgi:translation elongation factor EF-Ts
MLQLLRRSFSSKPILLDIISKLRDQTSLGVNLCRKAALESNLDFNRALEILAKSSNITFKPSGSVGMSTFGNDGLVGIMGSTNIKCLLEV